MSAGLLFVFVLTFGTAFARRGTSCITPNGETVTCVAARSCKVIVEALQTENSSAIDFAKQSECGFDTELLYCCGPSGYPTEIDINNLFTKPPPIDNKSIQEEEDVILSNFNIKALPDRTVCGLERERNRLIGGIMTDIGEFPWMAALEYKSKRSGDIIGIRCGGSLINNRYVLTAAHCIINNEFKLNSVWLGDWQISEDPDCHGSAAYEECADSVLKLNIKTEIPHPYYTSQAANNDIGLLRLEKDVKYTDYIRPICLPPQNLPIPAYGTNLTVSGWGTIGNGSLSDFKLKVQVPLRPNLECIEKLAAEVNANQLCAGGEPGRDSCKGDSGGPLMRIYEDTAKQQTQWYQEGVVSFGLGCGREEFPASYTRVSRYTNWIINIISTD